MPIIILDKILFKERRRWKVKRIVSPPYQGQAKNYGIVVEFAGANRERLWLSILLLSCHEESVIAFMGEERVLRGGDNVLAATVEASLSEIKHDATEGWIEGRRGGVEVTPSQIFPYDSFSFV